MDWSIIQGRLEQLVASNRHGELRGALSVLNPVDIAQFMETLDPEKLLMVFRVLPKDISADVFSYMSADAQKVLLNSIGDKQICSIINDMFMYYAVDFLDELGAVTIRSVDGDEEIIMIEYYDASMDFGFYDDYGNLIACPLSPDDSHAGEVLDIIMRNKRFYDLLG